MRQRYTLSFSCLFEHVYSSMPIRACPFEIGSGHEFEIELITDIAFDGISPSGALNLDTKKGK